MKSKFVDAFTRNGITIDHMTIDSSNFYERTVFDGNACEPANKVIACPIGCFLIKRLTPKVAPKHQEKTNDR